MSFAGAAMSTSASSTQETESKLSKSLRILSCVRCHRRKIKCNREFPCTNCISAGAQCVAATPAPRVQRRRRFPERELLTRLRHYEDLLRQNNVKFEPLHSGKQESPSTQIDDESDHEELEPEMSTTSASAEPERAFEAKSLLNALTSVAGDLEGEIKSSEDREIFDILSKRSWQSSFNSNDRLLFGSPDTKLDLSPIHPEPAHIFRLWQIYLDNVNPLLKVTHTPSLQARIIDAASNIKKVEPVLEALMFSIYCMAVLSLSVGDNCEAMFGASINDLLARFQFGCQQALLNCGFLQTNDRDCLTAIFLYLHSAEFNVRPRSVSPMLGIAIRIAQRMKIHTEAGLTKCTVFEAEMRRRLWWSLVLFDTRASEMSDHQCVTLNPTWDCKIPLNVNDSDLRPEMKEPPSARDNSTDALFLVVRCEIGDFIRHSAFHLDFTTPSLKPLIDNTASDPTARLDTIQTRVEKKYLCLCDLEEPVHYLTVWFTRFFLAKCRLMDHLSRNLDSSLPQTQKQRDETVQYSLAMLETHTKMITSPLAKGLLWATLMYMPFIAYLQILHELRRQPTQKQAQQAWASMSDNYEAHCDILDSNEVYGDHIPVFQGFMRIVLLTWKAREAALNPLHSSPPKPRIVTLMQKQNELWLQYVQDLEAKKRDNALGGGHNLSSLPTITEFLSNQNLMGGEGGPSDFTGSDPQSYLDVPNTLPFGFEMDIDGVNWNFDDVSGSQPSSFMGFWPPS